MVEADRENFSSKEREGMGVLAREPLVPTCPSLHHERCGREELSVSCEEAKGARSILLTWADRSSWARRVSSLTYSCLKMYVMEV